MGDEDKQQQGTTGSQEPELNHHGEHPPSSSHYSIFSPAQKQWIIVIAASAGWFSTASSFIYFPAIPFLAQDLGVSVQSINLTVTSYLIASGIFPSITGNAADRYGRRLTFLISMAVYTAANLGLANQTSLASLFVLRMLQSAAISGSFAIAYGVVGDLTTPAQRGGYTGIMSIFLNTPPSVAPLISGLLLIRWNWRAIFWFLSIVSPSVLLIMLALLPETCRSIVGNGSWRTSWMNTPLVRSLYPPKDRLVQPPKEPSKGSSNLPNPFRTIALLKNQATLLVVICYAIYYTVYSCLQASLSTIFVDIYDISGLQAGLIYIPFGVACSIASLLAGKSLDRDYRIVAERGGTVINQIGGDDLSGFPIEFARLRTHKYFVLVCAPLLAAYGWVLQIKTHIAVPLILQFLIGFTNQFIFTSLNTLLVDLHPDQSATVQAANNLIRCELAAGGLAALDVMLRKLDSGWCFVVFAALHGLTLPTFWILERKGPTWRSAQSS